MGTIVNTIQEIIRHELKNVRVSEMGLVEEVYPHRDAGDDDNYGCDVRLKNSGLVLKRVPIATDRIGTAAIPNKGDLVLLAFYHGDVNQAVIIGRLYDDADRPPLNDSNEVIFRLPLAKGDNKTLKAAIRNIEKNDPPRELIIEMVPKITVRITDNTVRATAGKTEMKLDQPSASGGTITIVSGQTKITMNQDGDITVESAGGITLKATDDLTLEGQNIKLNADQEVDIQAQTQASITANMGVAIDGGLSATLQGTSISVNGISSFSP